MIQAATASSTNTYGMDVAAARTAILRTNGTQAISSPRADNSKQYLKDMEMPKPSEQTLAKSAFYRPVAWSAKISPPAAQASTGGAASAFANSAPQTAAAQGAAAPGVANPAKNMVPAMQAGAANNVQNSEKSAAIKPNTGCKTCQTRQYKDGSDDAGVSFQSASRVPSATAAISVASHEGEHVSRNSDKAQKEGRVVINKTVTFQMAFCPECKKMYVAGGTTSMTTAAASDSSANADVVSAKDLFGGTGDNLDTYA